MDNRKPDDSEEQPTLLIPLTQRAPVLIKPREWPCIGLATDSAGDHTTWELGVRQHADGRAIVYATYSWQSNSGDPDIRDITIRRGTLLPHTSSGHELGPAIIAVVRTMRVAKHRADDALRWSEMVDRCFASLPPQVL